MRLSDKSYNTLKWMCLMFLPAFANAYSSLAVTWGLPFAEQVPSTVNTIQLFLGTIIGVSTVSYNQSKKE